MQDGDDPSGEQYADGISRLNQIITLEQTQGIKIWVQQQLVITLVAGTNNYPIKTGGSVNSPRPMRALEAFYVYNTDGSRIPLILISQDEWLNLPNVSTGTANQGMISQFWPNKLQNELDINLWLTPDATTAANGTVLVWVQGPVTNFVGLTDAMNFPTEWGMWLHWALAADVATGQPDSVITRCEQRAERFRQMLEGWDVEDAATQFVPDTQRTELYMNKFL
ncbi:MAG: hypothetical protein ACYDB1_00805 [Acidiferrobacteraceae bacterium]